MIRPTFIALAPGELNYYLLVVRLGKYERRSNATYDPSSKMCVPSKTEDVNVFNIVTGTSEANMLTKHMIKNVIQINIQIMCANVSLKNKQSIAYTKTVIHRILLYVLVSLTNTVSLTNIWKIAPV